jgi:hypothetical protein
VNRRHVTDRRWLRVGVSTLADPFAAGRIAAADAFAGDEARLLVVFSSDVYDQATLLEGIGAAAGDVPLVGCSTAGEIATGGPGDAGVVVAAFGGEGFTVRTAVANDVASRGREAAANVATAAFTGLPEEGHRMLLLLSDGLGGDQQEIVRGAYSVLGAAVPLVGGCAGDGLKMVATRQLHGRESYRDAVVGAAIVSDGPIGIGVRHGWRKVGTPMLVTESRGKRVFKIEDRPALDVYLERLGAPPEARVDAAAFTEFALTHPLGLDRRASEEQVRFVGEADFDERSLVCIAEVPQGGVAWFMEGDEGSVLDATDAACAEALEALGGAAPIGVLAFDCIARRGVLGESGIVHEVSRIADHAGGAPVAGFYSYGEFARTRGVAGFHNQTLVVLAVA